MNRPFRSLSTFLTGVSFFACFVTMNCQPTGGDPGIPADGTGGKGTGGKEDTGGAGGKEDTGGSGGKGDTGGSDGTGGKGTGGKNTGGSAGGGSAGGGSGGNGGGGTGGSGSGGNGTGGNTTSGSGGNTTPTGGATGGGSLKCNPTSATGTISTTGGLACPGGLCTVDTYSGYIYVYGDGTSTVCAGPDALCAAGNTGVGDDAGKIWGAGVGFNLDKTEGTDIQLSGTGITYALSALPTQGMRIQVSVAKTDYCVNLTAASGTVKWTDFSDACWGTTGTKLTAAPKTPHIGFQVTAAKTAGKFDFCVKSVSLK
jgi:hypothetical protein